MWHGVSGRKIALLVLGPFVVEMIATLFVFWMALETTRKGIPPRMQMLVPAAWAVTYTISAFLAGRWVTPRVAPALMIGAIFAIVGICLGAMVIDRYVAFIFLSAAAGAFGGHYYVPFQINMAHVKPFRTLAWTIACYCIALGVGSTCGPYLAASLRAAPVIVFAVLACALAVFHTLLQVLALTAPSVADEADTPHSFASTALQRLTGFVAIIVVGIVYRGTLMTLWPDFADQRGWSDLQVGLGVVSLVSPIALLAPVWARIRGALGTPWVMLGSIVIGLIGYVILPFTNAYTAALGCLFLTGGMFGCVLFHALYYVNADPHRQERSVGVVEALAGAQTAAGLVVMGLLAWDDATAPRTYIIGSAALAAVCIGLALMWLIRPATDQPR